MKEADKSDTFLTFVEKVATDAREELSGNAESIVEWCTPFHNVSSGSRKVDAWWRIVPCLAQRTALPEAGRIRMEEGGFGFCFLGTEKSQESYGPNLDDWI